MAHVVKEWRTGWGFPPTTEWEWETRDAEDPLIGHRFWRVVTTAEGPRLAGPHLRNARPLTPGLAPRLRPPFVFSTNGTTPAECEHGHDSSPCDGDCGLNAFHAGTSSAFYSTAEERTSWAGHERDVWGVVALYGRMKLHAWILAEHLRILELFAVDGRLAGDLAEVYGVPSSGAANPAVAASRRSAEIVAGS